MFVPSTLPEAIERCQKPSGTFIKIIRTFRQSLRNAFAAACFALADPLHPTTSLANPFAEFLLLLASKISERGIIPNLQPLLSPHLREPFTNLSPGYQESLDDMLCTENLSRQPFRNKILSSKNQSLSPNHSPSFPQLQFSFRKDS